MKIFFFSFEIYITTKPFTLIRVSGTNFNEKRRLY